MVSETENVPPGTSCACVVAIGRDIFMAGGYTCDTEKDDAFGDIRTDALWKLTRTTVGQFNWHRIIFHNTRAIPAPMTSHQGWEHEQKMWTFAGSCMHRPTVQQCVFNIYGECLKRELSDPTQYVTNQLNCFDPIQQEWANIQSLGAIPSPRFGFGCTKIQKNVYVHGGMLPEFGDTGHVTASDFYELHMETLVWTKLATEELAAPMERSFHSLTAIGDYQMILYAGRKPHRQDYNDTWAFCLKTRTWREITRENEESRAFHSAIKIRNSILIIGGSAEYDEMPQNISQLCLTSQPMSLEQLSLRSVHKHRDRIQPKDCNIPPDCYERFRDMIL